jgi:predicted nucleic acid-binding protein
MTIDRDTLLFFDASCLIAAAGSPTGGSGFLLSLCARGFLKAAVSQMVLLEAQRNIQTKLGSEAIRRFYNLLAIVPFYLVSLPGRPDLDRLVNLVNKKDVHVIASALEVHAPFLLTLDNGLIVEINQANLGVLALTPGDFIKTGLTKHLDYPARDSE